MDSATRAKTSLGTIFYVILAICPAIISSISTCRPHHGRAGATGGIKKVTNYAYGHVYVMSRGKDRKRKQFTTDT